MKKTVLAGVAVCAGAPIVALGVAAPAAWADPPNNGNQSNSASDNSPGTAAANGRSSAVANDPSNAAANDPSNAAVNGPSTAAANGFEPPGSYFGRWGYQDRWGWHLDWPGDGFYRQYGRYNPPSWGSYFGRFSWAPGATP